MAEAAESICVVTEEVRVDGSDPDPVAFGVGAQAVPIVDAVPRDVDGDAGTATGEFLDERCVGEPLVSRA